MQIKLITTIALCVAISGCSFGDDPAITGGAGANIICLQGVQYYNFKKSAGYNGYGYLAPVFDAETSKVKLCEPSYNTPPY